jgi:hypothetical protein
MAVISSDLEGGRGRSRWRKTGRTLSPLTSLTTSCFSVVLLRAGSRSQLRVHAERRRRPATSRRPVLSCLVATSRRHLSSPRRVASPRPQRARSPRYSPLCRRTIQIRVFARVGRRPCGNFVFFARHVLHVSHVTSPTSTLARSRRGTHKKFVFCSGRPEAL